MPIRDLQDATDVDQRIGRVFAAHTTRNRTQALRRLFVNTLDFNQASGEISLTGQSSNVELPGSAHRVASLEGVHVIYIDLDETQIPTNRVRKDEASAAANLISEQLGDDLLLVFTNSGASQLHLIYPHFLSARPTLRRLIVERDLPRRTAVQQVANIYHEWADTSNLHKALDSVFDVEAVTREFFTEYKRVFDNALKLVRGFDSDEDTRLYTQTLFNRLMFVYFLSRKGWLTFKGDKDYLNALWHDYANAEPYEGGGEPNFNYDRLRPLFFGGLNNPNSVNFTETDPSRRLIGNVPFLNGGLFEPGDLDELTGVTVPDEAIRPLLTDLFDRFNFTVMESTPFDIEVAVDPEMLGKVFEELVTERHESGAYYTPRPVVSFMCREALKGYLHNRVSALSEDDIRAFVDDRDTDGISVSDAREIGRALDEISVVDPACGSGAYLLGMMQELVDLQTELYNAGIGAKSLYDLKLEIIQRNLYGADIDPFAVNIAMLRLWLSLSIDYDAPGAPPPLPNLDFKIVCGDSLLAPDPNPAQQSNMFADAITNSGLADLKARYMRENRSNNHKRDLRRQIDDAETDLRATLGGAVAPEGAVDWQVQFAEAFGRGGFDVVVANPPYVRFQKINKNYKNALRPIYSKATTGQSDLYCYFYVRALQLLADGGMHMFVCSNSWLDVRYGAKLQEYLINNAHITSIYESAVERQFSTADINTIISSICKTEVSSDSATRFISLRSEFAEALSDLKLRREITRTKAELITEGTRRGRFVGEKWGGKYLRAPGIYHHILNQYKDKLIRIGDIASVRRGIITGANDFFFLEDDDTEHWQIEENFLKPVMTTPMESNSVSIDAANLPHRVFMCHESKKRLAGSNALRYIQWGEQQGFHQKSAPASRKLWYNLGNRNATQTAINIFVGTTARTVLAPDQLLFSDNFQTIYSDKVNPTVLCASMNSTFCQLVINVEGRTNFGQGVLEIQTYEIAGMPIVNPQLLPEPDLSLFDSEGLGRPEPIA